jgi:pyridoxamine 5'-phosphate oxidase
MVLATASLDGRPSSRTVLCKGLDARGVVFYTNHTSAKGHDLRATRYACATFPWYLLHRQVHVRGPVELVSPEETQVYWATRPRGSQLGAWASPQSSVIPDRETLDAFVAAAEERFGDADIPAPPFWGGYRVRPDAVEFWQHQDDRLHDRLRYRRDGDDWTVERLAP